VHLLYFLRNDAFVGRTILAAIDHNNHVFRKAAVTAKGKVKYNKVYSKRSKNWRIVTVKESKTYDFWSTLAVRILQKRIDDDESIKRKVVISKEHPKNIAASIAMKAIPKTADLVQQSLSRFSGSNSSDVSQLVEGSNQALLNPM
jgi:cystathionine beta-lyase family protein involved in aluminum resistance